MKRKQDLLPLVDFFEQTLRKTLDGWGGSQASSSSRQWADSWFFYGGSAGFDGIFFRVGSWPIFSAKRIPSNRIAGPDPEAHGLEVPIKAKDPFQSRTFHQTTERQSVNDRLISGDFLGYKRSSVHKQRDHGP